MTQQQNEVATKQQGALTKVGISLANAMLKTETTKRDLLLSLATKYQDKAHYSIILDSYKAELVANGVSENSAGVRRSEALQVIKAVGLTEVSQNHLVKLTEFKGEYNSFIDCARSLIKELEAKNGIVKTPRKVSAKAELTGKQIAGLSESLDKASINQLDTLISEATSKINSKVAPAIAGLRQYMLISSICNNVLNNVDIEEPLKEGIKNILKISEANILNIQNVMKATAELNANVTMQEEVTE